MISFSLKIIGNTRVTSSFLRLLLIRTLTHSLTRPLSFDYLSDVTNTRVYIFAFFVAAWVLPLNVISFSYLSIVTTVSRQERYCDTCQEAFNSFKHQSIKKKKSVEVSNFTD